MARQKWYLPLTGTQVNKLEKALNRLLGGHYFPTISVDYDGDGNIDLVTVDLAQLPQQADVNNVPTGKYLVEVGLLKHHLDGRGPILLQKIKARYSNVDIRQYIINNRISEENVIFYIPPTQ